MTRISRRHFLRFLASSSALTVTSPYASAFESAYDWSDSMSDRVLRVISSPEDALNVFDFSRVAEQKLPPAHYGHMVSGSDGGGTLRANRDAFRKIFLRARRLVDVSTINTELNLLGQDIESPILLAPVGGQKMFHPEGELAVARAARSRNHVQVLSNVTTSSIEEVSDARQDSVWFQLYPTSDWSTTRTMLRRAENTGSPVVMLTVDVNAGLGNRELAKRFAAMDKRDCSACHSGALADWLRRRPMYDGAVNSAMTLSEFSDQFFMPSMTWDYIDRLKDATTMKVVVKGIVRADDAARCIEHGADGLVVSNHGGNAEASGWGTLDCLPMIADVVDGRIPIIVDSGFRRGTDIYKALALGADAVMIGRAYLWGLAAFGTAGVEKVLALLRDELSLVMRQMGSPTLADIKQDRVGLANGFRRDVGHTRN